MCLQIWHVFEVRKLYCIVYGPCTYYITQLMYKRINCYGTEVKAWPHWHKLKTSNACQIYIKVNHKSQVFLLWRNHGHNHPLSLDYLYKSAQKLYVPLSEPDCRRKKGHFKNRSILSLGLNVNGWGIHADKMCRAIDLAWQRRVFPSWNMSMEFPCGQVQPVILWSVEMCQVTLSKLCV